MKTAQVICIHSANGKSYCGLPIADVFRSMTAPRLTCKACSRKLQFALTGRQVSGKSGQVNGDQTGVQR